MPPCGTIGADGPTGSPGFQQFVTATSRSPATGPPIITSAFPKRCICVCSWRTKVGFGLQLAVDRFVPHFPSAVRWWLFAAGVTAGQIEADAYNQV